VYPPPLPAGANDYTVSALGSSSSLASDGAVVLRLDPDASGRTPLVVTANMAAAGERVPVGYIVVPEVDLAQDEVTVGGSWAPPLTHEVEVTGLPETGGRVRVARRALVDGLATHVSYGAVVATSSTGAIRGLHPDLGDGAVYELTFPGGRTLVRHRAGQTSARARRLDGAPHKRVRDAVANRAWPRSRPGGDVGRVVEAHGAGPGTSSTLMSAWCLRQPTVSSQDRAPATGSGL